MRAVASALSRAWREALVLAVKAEVDAVHLVSSRSRADLQYVAEHRNDVTTLRAQVEDLLGRVNDTDQKIATIESREQDGGSRAIARQRDYEHARRHQRQPGSVRRAEGDARPRRPRSSRGLDFMVQEGAEHAPGAASASAKWSSASSKASSRCGCAPWRRRKERLTPAGAHCLRAGAPRRRPH